VVSRSASGIAAVLIPPAQHDDVLAGPVVGGGLAAGLITAFVAGLFGLLWFVFPLTRRY
jgi:hypothetical protein